MNSNRRLHSVLLTLWDIARDNPNYDRKLWGELQFCLSQLETRNNLLCALLADLLHCTDSAGNVMWEAATIHSPPEGYAVKFMQEELAREKRPSMPPPRPVIPTDHRGCAVDPTETPAGARRPNLGPPPPISSLRELQDVGADSDYDPLIEAPIGVGEEYDVGDESDEEDLLAFEFDSLGSEDTTE